VIIQALTQYYDILSQDEYISLPRLGYSAAKVSFVLSLSPEGEIRHIIDIRTKDKIPKEFRVPKQNSKTSGIAPSFLCEKAKYIFGVELIPAKERDKVLKNPSKILKILEDSGKDIIAVTTRSKECFEAFRLLHHSVLDSLKNTEVKQFFTFLDSWVPENFLSYSKIAEYKDEIVNGALCIFESNGTFLHDIADVRKQWESYLSQNEEGSQLQMQCLVSGTIEPISRTHDVIKSVAKAHKAGARLVSFNKPSFESYGRIQSFNAPVGKTSEFKYTTVLNYLLAERKNRLYIADSTVVFWAETSDSTCENLALSLFNPPFESEDLEENDSEQKEKRVRDTKTIQLIGDILKKVRNAQPLDSSIIGADPETRFYVLGLSPNNARLAVRFWYRDTYGEFVKRIVQHYLDLEIVKGDFGPPYLSIVGLLKETVPKTVDRGEPSPILGGLMLNAVLNGTPYPVQMYYAIVNRVKTERSINYARAGFIKAYLLRLSRSGATSLQEDLITMSLNEASTNVPYRLGRLFAVLERVQSDTNKEMGSTITSKYFSSASATPAVVFPVLLKLAQHHIAKSDWGFKVNRDIEEILSGVDSFPAFLSLEEQGMFMLGFYHQKQAFFAKKSN